jgi:hypothetical protein
VRQRDGLQRGQHRRRHLLAVRRSGHRRALALRSASRRDREGFDFPAQV